MDGLAGLYPGANRFPEHRRTDVGLPGVERNDCPCAVALGLGKRKQY